MLSETGVHCRRQIFVGANKGRFGAMGFIRLISIQSVMWLKILNQLRLMEQVSQWDIMIFSPVLGQP